MTIDQFMKSFVNLPKEFFEDKSNYPTRESVEKYKRDNPDWINGDIIPIAWGGVISFGRDFGSNKGTYMGRMIR
jgi:hypothetical protein